MHIESEVARQYGWGPRDFDELPASEICEHYILLKLRDAEERLWALQVSAYPDMDKRGRSALLGSINVLLAQIRGDHQDQYRSLAKPDRIRVIGAALRSRSRVEWERRHPDELTWLASVGASADDAIQSATEFHAAAVADLQSLATMKT